MRILYVSHYFPPDLGAPAARVYELSREWVKAGHEVSVLTGFAHHPVGKKAPADRWRLTRRESVDGIDVIRSYVYAAPNKGSLRRMLSYLSFLLSAVAIGPLRATRPDVLIATSPQLLCGTAGYLLARILRVPFVFEVRDLWPESILAVSAMRENLIISGLRRMARMLYRRADCIVTVGEGYRRSIAELYDVPLSKMEVIPNGIDPDLFSPQPRDNTVRDAFGWQDRFVVSYIGTHGMAHGLEVVLEAAAELQSEPDIRFVLIGEGAEKERLMQKAANAKLSNVQFIDGQPKEKIPEFYAASDLGLITLRNVPRFQEVLPSKMFEYLGMQRPVLINVDGEARKVLEAAGGGRFVSPEDPTALADAVRHFRDHPDELAAMGRSGREYVLEHFHRRKLAAQYLELLAALAGDHSRPSPQSPAKREISV